MRSTSLALAGLVIGLAGRAASFVPAPHRRAPRARGALAMTSTTLNELNPFSKSKMPDSPDREDGLKVTPNAWKWPPSWPFAADNFAQSDAAQTVVALYDDEAPVSSVVFEDATSAKFAQHCQQHIPQGATVLDLGAGERSHLPESLGVAKLVGLGLNAAHLDANAALDERLVRDLNSDPSLPYADDAFDAIVMTNAVEFLTSPRELFREVWRVLKPGGVAIIGFTNAKFLKDGHEGAQLKLWKEFNDAQHIWTVGAYFQFSAGAGWKGLAGYDLIPAPSAIELAKPGFVAKQQLMLVQANKVVSSAETTLQRQLLAKLFIAPNMEQDDKQLCCARLDMLAKRAGADAATACGWASQLPSMYEILKPMATVLPVPLLAQLASNMAPKWTNSATQVAALQEGLGLITPQPAFWQPMGELTSALSSDDKVWLLADLAPLFGSESDAEFLNGAVPVLEAVQASLRERVPEFALEEDEEGVVKSSLTPKQLEGLQLLSVDLLTVDYLVHGRAELKDDFLDWVATREPSWLSAALEKRMNYKDAGAAAASGADADALQVEQMLQTIVANQNRYRREIVEWQKMAEEAEKSGGDGDKPSASRDYTETRGPVMNK